MVVNEKKRLVSVCCADQAPMRSGLYYYIVFPGHEAREIMCQMLTKLQTTIDTNNSCSQDNAALHQQAARVNIIVHQTGKYQLAGRCWRLTSVMTGEHQHPGDCVNNVNNDIIALTVITVLLIKPSLLTVISFNCYRFQKWQEYGKVLFDL